MEQFKALTTTLSIVFAAGAANADELQCGQAYKIKSGDFLTKLAQQAYGDTSKFTFIYSANSDVIGPNPGKIQVGQELMIPCLDTPIPASTANAGAITNKNTTEAIPAPTGNRPIRILSATGWAPYLDEDQEQGGMLTEIVNLAMQNAKGKPEYKIDFINDDGAHLNPLLVDHAYDLSIGWSKPDCDNKDDLEDDSLFRCNNILFSNPIYEDVDTFYTLASEPRLTQYEDLRGKSICRPEGYSMMSLEQEGLAEPDVTIVRAPSADACLDMVIAGDADTTLVGVTTAEAKLATLPDPNVVALNEALNFVDLLHVTTAKTNPRAEEILATFNDGLANIKDSGVWFQTVRRHMTEFREKSKSK